MIINKYPHQGGLKGRFFRRSIHLSTALIPFFYYFYLIKLPDTVTFFIHIGMLTLIGFIFVCDLIRLKFNKLFLGQRPYELKKLSAFFYAALGIVIVLIITPFFETSSTAVAVPVIVSFSLVDPLLGELRQQNCHLCLQILTGYLSLILIWGLSVYFLNTPLLLLLIIPPITLIAEWPNWKKLDDNITMLLIPWLVALFIK